MKTLFKSLRTLIIVFSGIFFFTPAFSQAGSNDLTFNPTDHGFGNGANGTVSTTSIQNDGKIILAGDFILYNGTERNSIARLNTDGKLDAGFTPGTGANGGIRTTAIQPDGKIIIGGTFTSYNGTGRNYIARLNIDGSLDASFNPGIGADSLISTIIIQSNGKIIIGGNFATYNGTARNRIARLNTDGSLDAGFNPGTGVEVSGTSLGIFTTLIQSDGKIIIGGDFNSYNGTGRKNIARLNTDGSLDAAFIPGMWSAGPGLTTTIYTTSIQSDGKIIVGGAFNSYNGTGRNNVARLNSDGSLDGGFNPGSGANDIIFSSSIQSDGKILIGGSFSSYNATARNYIARLNTNGSVDISFNSGAEIGPNSSLFTIALQTDGKILIGGFLNSFNERDPIHITRLNNDGTLDIIFNPGTGANGVIDAIAIQSDGKIIIGGRFTSYNGKARNNIARLNADGSLDTSFDPGTGSNATSIITPAESSLATISIQSDGKIIIGGSFTSYNGITRNGIARLNTNGSLDASFNPGTGVNGGLTLTIIIATSIQSDGKILIGGDFNSYNGTGRNNIARLNADGSLDVSFNPGIGANNQVRTISPQSDGKIILGGLFNSYNGTASNYIARLNTNGSLDASFITGIGPDFIVWTTAIQSDGKIIIGGNFTTYNGVLRNNIARLNTNGSLDASFNPGSGADNVVFTSAIQSDGKIIIGGNFFDFNGNALSNIARLNSNGSLDAGFNTGTGADNALFTTAIQSDGKIVIGGGFTSYNDIGRNRIARIIGGGVGTSPSDYFRTINSGNWNTPGTWESSPVANFSTGIVSPASVTPDFNALGITIRGPHIIRVTANVTATKTTVETSGTLIVENGITLTVK